MEDDCLPSAVMAHTLTCHLTAAISLLRQFPPIGKCLKLYMFEGFLFFSTQFARCMVHITVDTPPHRG